MKIKKKNLSSQVLIITLGALVLGLMLQMAQAEVIQINMPQKSLAKKLMENTHLTYYQQIMGPTVAGSGGETYNVFQEARSPYQSFHAASLRYQVNYDWSFGVSLAAVNAYGDTVTNQKTGQKSDTRVRDEFFNARAFVNLPGWRTSRGTLFTTLSYEAPTSVFSQQNDMRFGWVLAQSFALKLPDPKFNTGLMWQYYRMVFKENVVPPKNGYLSLARQTTIVSGGPYLGYRFNDNWGINSSITFDWDQRGKQTGTASYNNNLPDRARLGVSYFPSSIKQIANVGIFTQSLLKYTPDTHVVGGELALKF